MYVLIRIALKIDKTSLNYHYLSTDLALRLTLSESKYPWVEQIPMVPITKTSLFKYTANFTTKKIKFSDKKLWYFLIFLLKT